MKKTQQELLDMVDELRYAEVFDELDNMWLNSEAYNRLKKEFILGKADIDFNDRLKTLINQFFNQRTENSSSEGFKHELLVILEEEQQNGIQKITQKIRERNKLDTTCDKVLLVEVENMLTPYNLAHLPRQIVQSTTQLISTIKPKK